MPYALIIFGAMLLVSSVRNTQGDLFTLLKGDFSGNNNFIFWMLSIFAVGAIGYVPKLKPISTAFLVLIVTVLFLSRKGFFDQFMAQIKAPNTTDSKAALSGASLTPSLSSGLAIPTIPTLPQLLKL